jgi:hypothetical protein
VAFTDLNDQIAYGSIATASTLTFSTTLLSDVVAGDLLVLFWGTAGVGMSVSSITDNGGGGQTWNFATAPKSGVSATHGFAYCKAVSGNFGTTITVNLNTTTTRRAGTLMAFHAANGNPVLAITGGAQNDAASPVDTSFTGTLPAADCLGIVGYGWHTTTSSAPGLTWTEPVGFTPATTFGDTGASSNRFAEHVEFKANIGSTASIRGVATYTVLTGVHSWILIFTDTGTGTVFTQGVSGAVTFVGAAPKKASTRRLPGALSFSGARTSNPVGRILGAGLAPTGSLARQLTLLRSFAGSLSFSGVVSSGALRVRSLVGAVFTPTGAISSIKSVSKAVSGALTFVGSQTHQARKALTATLTPAGALNRALSLLRSMSGVLTMSGATLKRTNRTLSATEHPTGMVGTSLPATHFFGVFRPTGAVTNAFAGRALYATLQATSSLARFTTRRLVASLIAGGVMNTQYIPPAGPIPPGGGGFGALMDEGFFQRYQVAEKWRHMKRVKL